MNQELIINFIMGIQLPVFAVFAVMSLLVLMWKLFKVIFVKPWKQGRRKAVVAYFVTTIIIGAIPMTMVGENAVIALVISMAASMIIVSWYTIWVSDLWTAEDKYAVCAWYVLNPYVWVSEQIVVGAYDMYDSITRLRK